LSSSSSFAMMMNVFCFPAANSFLGAINEQKFPLPLLLLNALFLFTPRLFATRARLSLSLVYEMNE
jgi:hypothetical protein|tara:strand:+ start:1157 stop:1354 length:198 start_codon:yes stop_codon:yes gene_type:complete